MHREYHQWYSHNLQRNMELLVFGHGGKSVLFFPTRMARFFDYENWGIVAALGNRISNGELQLFCVDSVDNESFYNHHIHPASRMERHVQYEEYIVQEVLPLMQHKSQGNGLQVAGCSMGAFHAINIAFRHPYLFSKVTAMSGRYDLTQPLPDFKDLFDGYHNQTIYFNMPAQYLSHVHDPGIITSLQHLDITLAVGQTDPFLGSNQYLSQLLWSKHIAHRFYIWNGYAHRPRYWRQMVQLYL